jgi:predicted ATPase/DNA-binding NarL/FixJ family response regulator
MTPSKGTRRPGNLPAELTSFVGRRREIADVKRLLTRSRLVTLTGSGGGGKTRLALRVAAGAQRTFPDGAWFVDLAALTDEGLLAQTIASTLGLNDRTSRWPTPQLTEYLGDKRLLLILDSCEHLCDSCAVFAQTVLQSAPGVHILGTSRQALGLTGEHLFNVPSLAVPASDRTLAPETVGQYEAVNLFLERAGAVQPRLELTHANCQAIVRVCQRLEGIPLAIEMAVTHLRALSVEQVLERLEDRFRFLTVGDPAAQPRHQTLRALIDWSSDLCTEQERLMWSRLSVFRGGFDLRAAESVCFDENVSGCTVADLLLSLVDKSVVITEEQDGQLRYRLLEMSRQHGLEGLGEAETEDVRLRHKDHFAHLVEQAWTECLGPHQEQWLTLLLREHHNIRAALEFSLTHPDHHEAGLRMTGSLWFFWIATGRTSEGRRWLERGLRLSTAQSRSRARALWVCGYLCIIQEDLDAAQPLIAEYERHVGHLVRAHPASNLQLRGMAAMSEGRLAQARTLLNQALDQYRSREDPTGILDSCFYLVAVTALLEDPRWARDLCEHALELCDSYGERWLKSYLTWDLGLVAWQQGDSARAAACGRDALRLARAFDEQWVIAFGIEILAWTANSDREHLRAARLFGAADSIWRRIGAPMLGMRHLISCHEQCKQQVRQLIGDETFDGEFHTGAQMTVHQAVAYALGEELHERRKRTHTSDLGLTTRETEVAGLVARGMSNKAIAAELVIAQRTAEAHVEHILTKLGFSSRAQIAAWAAEHHRPRIAAARQG